MRLRRNPPNPLPRDSVLKSDANDITDSGRASISMIEKLGLRFSPRDDASVGVLGPTRPSNETKVVEGLSCGSVRIIRSLRLGADCTDS